MNPAIWTILCTIMAHGETMALWSHKAQLSPQGEIRNYKLYSEQSTGMHLLCLHRKLVCPAYNLL